MLICPSHVVAVQVYKNGARVTRKVYPKQQGHDLVWAVKDLDETLDPHSIQIQVQDGHQLSRYSWYVPPKVDSDSSTSQLTLHQIEHLILKRKEEVYRDLRKIFLETDLNQAFSSKGVHLTEDYQDEYHRNLVRLEQSLKSNQELLEYNSELGNQSSKKEKGKDSKYLCLHFKMHFDPNQPILVSYFTPKVSWKPIYCLYTSTQGDEGRLCIEAEVCQSTGEDWIGIELSVSSDMDPYTRERVEQEMEYDSLTSYQAEGSTKHIQSGFWTSWNQMKSTFSSTPLSSSSPLPSMPDLDF
jgi:hypothetical protein